MTAAKNSLHHPFSVTVSTIHKRSFIHEPTKRERERERERMREMVKEMMEDKSRVCVTGAGGFVASWLVKLLLSEGYMVHGTVRDPSDDKNAHLKKLENSSENLQLFKADLHDHNDIAAAITGCEGVFHVASPVPSAKVSNPEVELISPAVVGTINVLQACCKTKVKRVVVVSSIVSVMFNPNWPQETVMDENCWSDKGFCRKTENWYSLSKTLAEEEAFSYAQKHGVDAVSLCPSIILGPLLQSTVNTSSLSLINILKGAHESIENRNWHYVDVRDVADAALLVYKKPEAFGRYICTLNPVRATELIEMLKDMFPGYMYPKNINDVDRCTKLTSEKLKKLGWRCRSLEEILIETVKFYEEASLLSRN